MHDREVAGGEVTVEVVHVGADLEAVVRAGDSGSIRGPATTIIRRAGTRSFASGYAAMTRRRRSAADARPADGDEADRSSSR